MNTTIKTRLPKIQNQKLVKKNAIIMKKHCLNRKIKQAYLKIKEFLKGRSRKIKIK